MPEEATLSNEKNYTVFQFNGQMCIRDRRKVIEAYDVWKEKKNYGKVSMGVVRTTYLIDEQGIIIKANDKVCLLYTSRCV